MTTGGQQYLTDLEANRYHTANVSTLFSLPGGFSWASVAALGQLDLATVPSNISNHSAIVQSVVDAADMLMAVQQNSSNGYGVFLTEYPWGSNSNNLNNIQVSTPSLAIILSLTDKPPDRSNRRRPDRQLNLPLRGLTRNRLRSGPQRHLAVLYPGLRHEANPERALSPLRSRAR